MMNKMAELKFEAPLAQFEESDEWTKMMDDESPLQPPTTAKHHQHHYHYPVSGDMEQLDNMVSSRVDKHQDSGAVNKSSSPLPSCAQCGAANNNNLMSTVDVTVADTDNFGETFSGSLEDLVHTFDDKITRCFCDYEESVEKLAPVQIRTQEEIMNECQ